MPTQNSLSNSLSKNMLKMTNKYYPGSFKYIVQDIIDYNRSKRHHFVTCYHWMVKMVTIFMSLMHILTGIIQHSTDLDDKNDCQL